MRLDQYTEQERIFLAGSIKALLLTRDTPGREELDDLDRITERLGFDDYEPVLEKFEEQVKDDESWNELLAGISRPDIQEDVLSILEELSVQEGYPSEPEQKFIGHMRDVWGR